MRSPGRITLVQYDEASMRLRVEFDSLRVTIFHKVPKSVADALRDRSTRDVELIVRVLGKYGWTERGVPSYG